MHDTFVPPPIPAAGTLAMPPCPRRLLNERTFLKDADDAMEAPMMGAQKTRMRYVTERPVLVNDAGMVREPTLKGQQI